MNQLRQAQSPHPASIAPARDPQSSTGRAKLSHAKELVLPWPSRDLHPNSRGHWSKRAKAAKAARKTAWTLVLQSWTASDIASLTEGSLHVWIDGYPPDRRRRDADGLLSSLKPWLDGIADALGVDDRRFVPHPYVKDEVRKGGEVRIRITGGPESCGNSQQI